MQYFGVFIRISGCFFHSVNISIQCLFALRLSRFGHEGFVNYQGEIDGRGVKTIIKQTLAISNIAYPLPFVVSPKTLLRACRYGHRAGNNMLFPSFA